MDTNDIYEKVIESAQDIKYIREDITELKNKMEEDTEACNKRISYMEGMQNLNAGKLTVVLVVIGAIMIAGIQLVIWLMDKIIK